MTEPMAHTLTYTWLRIVRYCVRIYLLVRVSTLGFTLLLPLLGAASSGNELGYGTIAVLISVGLAFHVYAYVLNDVVDLQLDRTEPLRSDSPLVQGVVTPGKAVWLALLQIPLAFSVATLAGATLAALIMLSIAFVSLTVYDFFGKRCRVPPLTDAIQALGWCALALFGAFSSVAIVHENTIWLVAYVFVYVLLINGIHGGVRDLTNDIAHRAQTTAIWLGAQPTQDSGARLTMGLMVYGFVLQGAMVLFAILALDALNYVMRDYWLAAFPVYAGSIAATLMLTLLLLRLQDRRKLVALGASHMFVSLSLLPALYLPSLGSAAMVTLVMVFTIPVVAMYLYNGSHWCL